MKWSIYNQSLVRRGEILLGFDVINNWDTELKEMNQDKIGEHFIIQTPFSFYSAMLKYTFIFLIDKLKVLHKDMLKEKYLPFQIIQR